MVDFKKHIGKKVLKKKKRGTDLEASRRVFDGIDDFGNKFLKLKLGENRIRILPSNREDGAVVVKSIQHFGFKVDGKGRAFPCMSTLKKPCPVCKVISHHDSDDDPDVKDALKQISPRQQYLFNVLDRKDAEPTVKILTAGVMIAKEVNNFLNDDDYGDITDPDTGRDIKITKTGEGWGTKYSTRTAASPSQIDMEGLELFNLENERYREIPTAKQYAKYLEDNFGNVLDVAGALGLSKKEDEEEEDTDDDEEEEEEEEDEQDIDEDETEDTDDVPPIGKIKPKKKVKKLHSQPKKLKKKTSRGLEDL